MISNERDDFFFFFRGGKVRGTSFFRKYERVQTGFKTGAIPLKKSRTTQKCEKYMYTIYTKLLVRGILYTGVIR